jgi:predicted DNA-binding transcriptional regulator AlpA
MAEIHQPKILFIKDVERLVNRNRLTLRRWWKKGKFPKPSLLNGTTLAWKTEVINEWINTNLKEAPNE